MSDDTRTCITCGRDKPFKGFGNKRGGGVHEVCVICRSVEVTRKARAADPSITRRMNLWRLYKIRQEQYDAMRAAQGYRCAICRRHEDELENNRAGRPRKDGLPSAEPMRLCVDHEHGTGRVRALLCVQCNQAIGLFGEDAARMEAAARYVREQSREDVA